MDSAKKEFAEATRIVSLDLFVNNMFVSLAKALLNAILAYFASVVFVKKEAVSPELIVKFLAKFAATIPVKLALKIARVIAVNFVSQGFASLPIAVKAAIVVVV